MRRQVLVLVVCLSMLGLLNVGPASARQPGSGTTLQCMTLPASDRDVTEADWATWTGLAEAPSISKSHHLSVDSSIAGQPSLRQQMVPSRQGTQRVVTRNSIAPARTYFLTQSVFLEPGFDWGRDKQGGKLGFGLAGGTHPSGGDSKDTAGFSSRFMWRGNGDGTAHLAVYAYTADRSGKYGDDYPLEGFNIPVGQWFDVAMEVTLNSSADVADGSVRAWANGELLLERHGIWWQSAGTPVIDYLNYATFYGGNGWEWAPNDTTYIRFANTCWGSRGETRPPVDPPDRPPVPTGDSNLTDLQAAGARIDQLLPADDGKISWRLNRALELLDEAINPADWPNEAIPDGNSAALENIAAATKKLLSAASASGATSAQRDAITSIVSNLSDSAAAISTSATERARQRLAESGCNASTSGNSRSCRDGLRNLRRAEAELDKMTATSDPIQSTYYAKRAWKRANAIS